MEGNGGAVGNERALGRGGALAKAGESKMEGQKLNLVENLVEYQEIIGWKIVVVVVIINVSTTFQKVKSSLDFIIFYFS